MSDLNALFTDREVEHAWTLEVARWEEEQETSPEVTLLRAETEAIVTRRKETATRPANYAVAVPLPSNDMTDEEIVEFLQDLDYNRWREER